MVKPFLNGEDVVVAINQLFFQRTRFFQLLYSEPNFQYNCLQMLIYYNQRDIELTLNLRFKVVFVFTVLCMFSQL